VKTLPLEDLPKPIQDHILKNTNFDDYIAKPNTYSVTDLLYCLRKTYFKKYHPKPTTLESAFNLYRGKVFDQLWTPLFKHNQVRCTHRIKNYPITISGKYDFIDEKGILTELKTAKSLFYINEAGPEYIKQVRFYAYVNAIDKAQIVYVDFGSVKVFPIEVGDCTQLIEELESKAILLWTAYQKGTPPQRCPDTPQWLCGKCDYQEECNHET
jgi:hypothetical protein